MATVRKNDDAYGRLIRAAQQLKRATRTPPSTKRSGAKTEVTALRALKAGVARALTPDLVELARMAIAEANRRTDELAELLSRLETERRDVDRRRKELSAATEGYDWTIHHSERQDLIGPLTIDHAAESSTISLGRKRIKIALPSGAEVFTAVRAFRAELEKGVEPMLETLRAKVLPLQSGPGGVAAWTDVLAAVGPKREYALRYVLALIRDGMVAGWRLEFPPPALAQQRRAITLRRIRRPATPDRLADLRLTAS